MKPIYLGGVRGYQSAVYRPGVGWSGTEIRRHTARRPAAPARKPAVSPYLLTLSRKQRPGTKTKVAILATMVALVAIMALVFAGGAQL